MKLTLKIAAGVFLGIIAVLIVRGITQRIESNAVSQRKGEELNSKMFALAVTPDDVIARCGKPLKEVSEDNGFVRERRLFYKDRLSGEVFVIGFDYPSGGDDDRASYARWGIVRGDHVVLGISVGGEKKLLGALPCLNDDTKVR